MSNQDELIIYEKGKQSIIGIYHPFKLLLGETSSSNFTRLLEALQKYITCHPTREVVIVGDFNIDYLKISDRTYQRHLLAEKLLDFQTKNGLEQHIKQITRHRLVTKNGQNILQSSLLDHVYSNSLLIDTVETLPSIASDHDYIKINLITQTKKSFNKTVFIRDWRRYSKNNFLTELRSMDWNVLADTNDVTT